MFSYVAEVTNRPEFWPSLVEVTNVVRQPDGGYKSRWVYKMAGVRTEGTSESTEFVPNQRMVEVNKGGVSSTIAYIFQPEGDGCKFTFDAEYTVEIPLLRKLAESFLVKLNENEADVLLANLKAKMEA